MDVDLDVELGIEFKNADATMSGLSGVKQAC